MRRFFIMIGLLLMTITTSAQQDSQAQQILENTITAFRKANSISLTFGGSQKGTLILQGACFYLDCDGIKSWFDGKTQWSYAQENEEVTISTPTIEELQSINPYSIITSYRQHYNYRYKGIIQQDGKQNYEILLTPRTSNNNNIVSVLLHISQTYRPVSITIQLSNGESQRFIIHSYKAIKELNIATFRFDPQKYPNAEIIDMR